MHSVRPQSFHFDIDDYLNRFVPRSQLYRLPKPIARFLGHRDGPQREVGSLFVWFWAALGVFCGIALVEGVVKASPLIQSYNPPIICYSLGAAAVLNYYAVESPLAQPRNSLIGHPLAAFVGVCITKLFMMGSDFEDLRWLAGAVSCAIATVAMASVNAVYPPGGAAALIAAVDPTVTAMGWMFVPFIMLGGLLMFIVSLLLNNVQRQYPIFWWTSAKVGQRSKLDLAADVEQASKTKCHGLEATDAWDWQAASGNITISSDSVVLPHSFTLGPDEASLLESLKSRLKSHRITVQKGQVRDVAFLNSASSEVSMDIESMNEKRLQVIVPP